MPIENLSGTPKEVAPTSPASDLIILDKGRQAFLDENALRPLVLAIRDGMSLKRTLKGSINLTSQERAILEAENKATDQLVNNFYGMIFNHARHYPGDLRELFQYGILGLIRAVETYNPDRPGGANFTAHARNEIKSSLSYGFCQAYGLPAGAPDRMRQLARAERRLSQVNERKPTIDELAVYLDWQPETVEKCLIMREASQNYQLDDSDIYPDSDDPDRTPRRHLSLTSLTARSSDTEGEALRRIRQDTLRGAITNLISRSGLTQVQAAVVIKYFLDPQNESQAAIGRRLGLPPSAVSAKLYDSLEILFEEIPPDERGELLDLLRSDGDLSRFASRREHTGEKSIDFSWFDMKPGGVYPLIEGKTSPVAHHIRRELTRLPIILHFTPENYALAEAFGLIEPVSRYKPRWEDQLRLVPNWEKKLPPALIDGLRLIALKERLSGLNGQDHQTRVAEKQTETVLAFLNWANLRHISKTVPTRQLAEAEEMSRYTLRDQVREIQPTTPIALRAIFESRFDNSPTEEWDKNSSLGAIVTLAAFVGSFRTENYREIRFSFPPSDPGIPVVCGYLNQLGLRVSKTNRTLENGMVSECYTVYSEALVTIIYLLTRNFTRIPLEVFTPEQIQSFMTAFFEVKGRWRNNRSNESIMFISDKVELLRQIQQWLGNEKIFTFLSTKNGRGDLALRGIDLLRFIRRYQPEAVNLQPDKLGRIAQLEEIAQREERVTDDFFKFRLALSEARVVEPNVNPHEIARQIEITQAKATLAGWAKDPPCIPHPVSRIINTLGLGNSPENIQAAANYYFSFPPEKYTQLT